MSTVIEGKPLTSNKADRFIVVIGASVDCSPLMGGRDQRPITFELRHLSQEQLATIDTVDPSLTGTAREAHRKAVGANLQKILGIDIDMIAFVAVDSKNPNKRAIEFVRNLHKLGVSTGIVTVTHPRHGTTCIGGDVYSPDIHK